MERPAPITGQTPYLLPVDELARRLAIPESEVRSLIEAHHIPVYSILGCRRPFIRCSDINAQLEQIPERYVGDLWSWWDEARDDDSSDLTDGQEVQS